MLVSQIPTYPQPVRARLGSGPRIGLGIKGAAGIKGAENRCLYLGVRALPVYYCIV